jgi:hypothetical protein
VCVHLLVGVSNGLFRGKGPYYLYLATTEGVLLSTQPSQLVFQVRPIGSITIVVRQICRLKFKPWTDCPQQTRKNSPPFSDRGIDATFKTALFPVACTLSIIGRGRDTKLSEPAPTKRWTRATTNR